MRSLLLGLVLLVAGCIVAFYAGFFTTESITEKKRKEVPPHVAQFLIEGQRASERGVYDYAMAMTDSVERYVPDLADLHFLRGHILTRLNQLDRSQVAYETVLELDPSYEGAWFSMGVNSFRRGKLRDAIDYYWEEEKIGGTTALFHEMGRAYARLGEPDSARWAYNQAIARDSTNAMAYMWLGQLLEETGDMEAALETSLKGFSFQPDDLNYQYIIGTQYFRLQEAENALPYLQPVAEKWKWHHGAQFNLGQVYMRLDREEEAQVYFVRADSAQQMQQKINEAQDAINRDPETLDNWINLGNLLRESGRPDRAAEAFKVAAVHMPWNLHLQNNLATLIMESGNLEEAIRRFQAILQVDPAMTAAWLNLGVAYAKSERNDDARSAWKQLLSLDPDHTTAHTFLGRLPASDSLSAEE